MEAGALDRIHCRFYTTVHHFLLLLLMLLLVVKKVTSTTSLLHCSWIPPNYGNRFSQHTVITTINHRLVRDRRKRITSTLTKFDNSHNNRQQLIPVQTTSSLSLLSPLSLSSSSSSSRPSIGVFLSLNNNENDGNDNVQQEEDDEIKTLYELLRPSIDCRVNQMSGTDLAYIGDVVYELFIRSRTVWPLKRTTDLQHQVVALVRAEHQSKLLSKIKNEFVLTDKEQQVLIRGRNAGSSRNNNRRNPTAYQDSTAIEALIGYLYISNTDRCTKLLHWIHNNIDSII